MSSHRPREALACASEMCKKIHTCQSLTVSKSLTSWLHLHDFITPRSRLCLRDECCLWLYRRPGTHCLLQWFSTGIPQNLRILPVVSKGSAGLPVLRHLRPLDAFSRLLVSPKCMLAGGASTPEPWAGGEGACCPHSRPSCLRIPPATKRHGFHEQSKLLQRVPLCW